MADNGNCSKCGAHMIVSLSDHELHFCEKCKTSKVFDLVVRVRRRSIGATILMPARITFDEEINLEEANERCKKAFSETGETFEIRHVQKRSDYNNMQIG